ncbi:polymorphic toxin-type HINT domain-containing protein [Paenibacillus thiaminolyticus]|uniref:polymorphic toxin-type HINT domain-containing protein n=1 Tax=Paenibacillus thiaminolyticus TaxID=49283 RepID=UPI0025433DAF|nr:polymorphic toxin-type HINT domain-containing protein [Paenibacillus thiaminolyticus]WII35263.1 polymorphic toxin-type HINT domain-containing protein [Paenibacillus thiaminolyticus]
MLFVILSFTSIPLASAQSIANCNLHCFSAGTPVQTTSGFKPIEDIRVGDFVLTKDELTGKTGYNAVIELFQRQANETYQITVKGITITTTEEHPFWIPGQGWVEARHLKPGDLLQNPEGKRYPIDRIEIKNDITTVYNFRVEGVHNYFVTETNNPNKWEQVKRYDGVGKGDGHDNKVTGQKVKEPHVHDPKTPGGIREPRRSGKETPMKW